MTLVATSGRDDCSGAWAVICLLLRLNVMFAAALCCGACFVVGNATTANCELYCWHENYISSNELFLFREDMNDIYKLKHFDSIMTNFIENKPLTFL